MNRIAATLVFAVIVLCPALSLAQGWRLYANQEDYFSVNFPGEPENEKDIYNYFHY